MEPARPSFGRSLGLFWLYTLLRFGLFGGLWLVLWLVGVGWLIAAAIAVILSIPLSWVLLARPRQAFAANIEQRVNARFERKAEFDAQLEGDSDDPPPAAE
jgi:O-antigen ligase